jgi:hypothetical protein
MSKNTDLRQLSGHTDHAPPFGFEQFEHRRARAEYRHRATAWSMAGSVGVLGVVGLLALMTQAPESQVQRLPAGSAEPIELQVEVPYQPAVVDLGRFDVTSDLEDHIAWLDAQISAAQVYAVPPERLQQLESTREQLNVSLQRVSYAQTLLSF